MLVVHKYETKRLLNKKPIDKQSLIVFNCEKNKGFQIPEASIFIKYDKNQQTLLYVND